MEGKGSDVAACAGIDPAKRDITWASARDTDNAGVADAWERLRAHRSGRAQRRGSSTRGREGQSRGRRGAARGKDYRAFGAGENSDVGQGQASDAGSGWQRSLDPRERGGGC